MKKRLGTFKTGAKIANLDHYYGEYSSIEEAKLALKDVALEGRQFIVKQDDDIVKLYLWQGKDKEPTEVGVGGSGGMSSISTSNQGNVIFTGKGTTANPLNATVDLSKKVDVENGKGLSSNDYTTTEKTKLAGLSNYTLPSASTSIKGGVKVDGTTITIKNDIISSVGGGIASIQTSNTGNVKFTGDGTAENPLKAEANVDVNIDSISTTQTAEQLNALADGLYFANGAGIYNISISNPTTGVTVANGKTTVAEGYNVSFNKKGSVWSLASSVSIPSYDDSGIKNILFESDLYSNKKILATKIDFIVGNYINTANVLVPEANSGVTDFIEVEPNTNYEYNGRLSFSRTCIEYDYNKKPIKPIVNPDNSSTVITNTKVLTSENTKYVRLSSLLKANNVDVEPVNFIKLEKVNKVVKSTPYIEDSSDVIESKAVYELTKKVNLYENNKKIADRNEFFAIKDYYLTSGNFPTVGVGFGVTKLIEIKPNTQYKWYGRLSYERVCLELNEEQQKIRTIVNESESSQVVTEEIFTTSSNAKYVRLSSMLVRDGVDIDCGLIELSSYNIISDSSEKLIHNKLNIQVPFFERFWKPSTLLNIRPKTSYQSLIDEYDLSIANNIYNNLIITKSNLGKDESGLFDLFSYNIKNKSNNNLAKQNKIVIVSNVHGSEYANSYSVVDLFSNLLTNSSDSIFNYLVQNFEWCIVPSGNPWGFENLKRSNSRGVNLNRNFPLGWKLQGAASDFGDYSGTEPLSESETKIIDNFLKENKDYIISIDGHSFSGYTENPNTMAWIRSFKHNINTFYDIGCEVTKYSNELFSLTNNTLTNIQIELTDANLSFANGTLASYMNYLNPNSTSILLETAMGRLGVSADYGSSEMNSIGLSLYVNTLISLIRYS